MFTPPHIVRGQPATMAGNPLLPLRTIKFQSTMWQMIRTELSQAGAISLIYVQDLPNPPSPFSLRMGENTTRQIASFPLVTLGTSYLTRYMCTFTVRLTLM